MAFSRHFDLDEANALVPWLESGLQEMEGLEQERERLQAELAARRLLARRNGHSALRGNREEERRTLNSLTRRLRALVEEIQGRDIILRNARRGLVDFPSLREGREVFLCWLRGEEEVRFWHESDTGFAGRQPL